LFFLVIVKHDCLLSPGSGPLVRKK
jgi:hypothetical protein